MATSLQHTSFHEPEPRSSAGGATIGDKFFIYRGLLESFKGNKPYPRASHVDVFAMRLVKWSTVQTTGQHPPSLWGFACVAIGHRIYYFGGYDGTLYSNALHEFDSIASHWRALDSANPDAAPMAKLDSAIIAVDDETLCTLGGFGMPTGRLPAGSRFAPSLALGDGRGSTNEIHLYSLRSTLWSSPSCTGEGPPPLTTHTFTRIDLLRAVVYGGWTGSVYMTAMFILNIQTWLWTKVTRRGPSQAWPRDRAGHSAFSLCDPASNPAHPCLLIACGLMGVRVYDDMWIWSYQHQEWEEVTLPESIPARAESTCGVTWRSSTSAQAAFFGGVSQGLRRMAETIVVDLELDLSRLQAGLSVTGWVATSVKGSAALACQAIYEEALQHGYVYYRSLLCLLTGVAGSGKSSLKEVMLNKPPPAVRHSTPMAEAVVPVVRDISCTKVDATEEEWEEFTDDAHSHLIASEMVFVTSGDAQESPEAIPLAADNPPPPTKNPSRARHSSTESSPVAPELTSDTSAAPPSSSAELASPPVAPSAVSTSASMPILSSRVGNEIVSHIATSSREGRPRDVDMIYILDSGGQQQFHDVLPAILEAARVMIFVTNLAQRLDHYPAIAYYQEGEPLAPPQPSPLTNEEVLQHSVQAVQSQAYRQGESHDSGAAPNLVLVGSHRDQEWACSESLAEKNGKLMSLLYPSLHRQLVFRGEGGKQVIFPINAKQPGTRDRKVVREIRRAIRKAISSTPREKIPIRWHVLERAMRHTAKRLRRGYLTREEGIAIAQELHISEEQFEAALDRFSRLSIVLYFRDVLPGFIFVVPQFMCGKLTALVQRSYEVRHHPDQERSTIGDDLVRLYSKGLVTLDFLNEFFEHSSAEFTPQHLIQVLLHRLVVAEVGEDEYFMPFILLHMTLGDLEKHRVLPFSAAAALVIIFTCGVPPSGLFPALTASLLSSRSSYCLELFPSSTEHGHPECVFRNCVKFRLPSGTPGSVTLIDSFNCFEVHVDAPPEVCSKLCPRIKEAIFGHLKDACSTLKFHGLSYRAAILCESGDPHGEPGRYDRRHHADIAMDTNTWTCSLPPHSVYGDLEKRHLVWFPTEAAAGEGPSIQEFQCLKWNVRGKQERIRIMTEVAPRWKEFGIALGFSASEIDTIDQGCLREPRSCIVKLFGEWTIAKPTYSWQGMIEALKDCEFDNLAAKVERFISNRL